MIVRAEELLPSAPPTWGRYRIRDQFRLLNGFPFASDDFKYDQVGLPLVRIRDLITGAPEIYVDGPRLDECTINNGDIVIGMDGDFNACWWSHGPAALNQRLCALRSNGEISQRFAFYQLAIVLKVINDLTPSSTVKHLSSLDVLALRLPAPGLAEQCAIASFLDRHLAMIDKLIDEKTRFLELIEEKRRSLITKLVDGSLIHGVNEGPTGWFGSIPSHWPLRRARFLFREHIDPSRHGSEELLTVSHITGVTARSEKNVSMFLAETLEGYKLVRKDDLVINTMWAWMGALGVSPMHGCVSPSYAVYRPASDVFLTKYLDLLVRSAPFVAEINRRSKGVWASRLRLYPDAFLDIGFPVPPLDEQKALVETLERELEREEHLALLCGQSIDLLKEHRRALITSAVLGQIDIRQLTAEKDAA